MLTKITGDTLLISKLLIEFFLEKEVRMGILTKMFAKEKKEYLEKDNRGTRLENKDQIVSYWSARQASQKFYPFAMYKFSNESDARNSLLSLDVIHEATDSHKLICTETLDYGYWGWEDGTFETFVCGKDLSHDLWKKAKEAFAQHGGSLKNDEEPAMSAQKKEPKNNVNIKKVKFVREERKPAPITQQTMTYRIHRGPDAETAKAFLSQHPVTKPLYYVIVETPEGNYGRDIDGIYRE
jgi:hypothetical protein